MTAIRRTGVRTAAPREAGPAPATPGARARPDTVTRTRPNKFASVAPPKTPETHPERFTADGQLKWKTPPPGVEVIPNTTGEGDWIEKWLSPGKPGAKPRWVHNYTEATMRLRAGEKFVDNRRFGRVLPEVRRAYTADLAGTGERRILATVVALIDQAYFRVGNDESDDHGSYGVTTLLRRHLELDHHTATFAYVGKHQVEQHKVVTDRAIAAILRELAAEAPNGDAPLFQYQGRPIDARDVNAYLERFGVTAKQFRTYHATRLAREELLSQRGLSPSQREQAVSDAVERVAERLGHTPAVCRGSYIDPAVVTAYLAGRLS